MGFCGGCAKALLIIFNFIFWLSGAAILGVGIWMIVDKNISSYFEVLNVDTHDKYFQYASYMLIAFGVFVFLVGFCGCCGAIRGSKCLLGLYIFFLFLIFAGELAAGVLMILYRVEIEDKIDVTLQDSIKKEYSKSTTISDAWDVVQVQLECCGGLGPQDYNGSVYDNDPSKVGDYNGSVYDNDPSKVGMFPITCCKLANKDKAFEDATQAMPLNATLCLSDMASGYYHTNGCKEELLDWGKQYTAILIGVGIGIACLQIFGIIAAICLCRQIDREDKY